MKQFISLHQLRYPIHMNITVAGDIESKKVIPLLLIGLAENAFKHSNMTDLDYPFVIDVKTENDRIEFFTNELKN